MAKKLKFNLLSIFFYRSIGKNPKNLSAWLPMS